MYYLIDGYNLLFRKLESGQSIQSQRQNLINALQKIINTLHLSAAVIFDSAYQEYEGSRSHIQTLEVVFTDKGQSADDYILDEIRRHQRPQQLIVISSDNKLTWRCRQLGAKTESCEEFAQWTRERQKSRKRKEKKEEDTTWTGIEVEDKEKTPSTSEKEPSPTPKKTAEESFDYYLKHFEKKDAKASKAKKKKDQMTPPAKEPEKEDLKKKTEEPPGPESEMERWLNIFEKQSDQKKP